MTIKDSLQVQIKILEEENIDLRTIMQQMRRRFQDNQRYISFHSLSISFSFVILVMIVIEMMKFKN